MKEKNGTTETSQEVRKKAEKLLSKFPVDKPDIAPDNYQKIIHDLQVHQIELALQNEELRETQLKLEESRAQYLDLYDHAPVGYFSFDEKGRILAVNLAGSRQLELERNALLKKPFTSFLRQEDSDLFYLHLKKVAATRKKQTCALTLLHENGTFYAQLDTVLSATLPGKSPLFQTTVTDITERKVLEEAVQVSETRYRRLFEAAREGILILDAKTGEIVDVNPFLTEMLGYSHQELLGKKLWELGCFKDIKASQSAYKQMRSKGYARYDNLPLETKNRRIIAVEFVSSIYFVNEYRVIQCNIREVLRTKDVAVAASEVHSGTERRVMERRADVRKTSKQLAQEVKEHKQIEDDLMKALTEIKTLKDRLVVENIYFRQEIKKKHHFDNIIGQSDGLKYVLYRAEQVAPTNTTVLVLGETGTGKELIAAAIHNLSPRKELPLITVNCAALPANLLESELFGREKGAFTGAETRQIGRFEVAEGSTLCLDEIGELPLDMQSKLLRVIQHGEFERLGSSKTLKVDVRLVATTNRNLEEEVLAGRFRKDLYYRLNVFPITVPPLRQRAEDIPLLVQAFVERYARKMGKQITSIPQETMKSLQQYPWPGNVRELESIIERAVILCSGPGFRLADKLSVSTDSLSSMEGTMEGTMGGTVKEMERYLIRKVLAETGWRIEGESGAAMILGLHPSTLRARMHKLGIVRPKMNESN